MIKIFLFLMLGGCLALPATAQKKPEEAFRLASEAHEANPDNYRAPLAAIRSIPTPAESDPMKGIYYQAMATYHAFAGSYDSALYYFDKPYAAMLKKSNGKGTDEAFVKASEFKNALAALSKSFETEQVVMLNEAHHNPAHRAFALNLLNDLYKQGFRHLALETLESLDTAQLSKRSYPVQETGFYQREPLFGELIRQAIKKGFSLIAYEARQECTPPSGNDSFYCNRFRDSLQAVNLARWVKKNPGEKLFVYAGYDHIHEQPNKEWKHMAEFFNEFTGLDPFTIDQVQMSERSIQQLEDPRYRALIKLKNIQSPVVALADDTLWSHTSKVDVTVFHPRYLQKTGPMPRFASKADRPDFYLLHNNRKPVLLSNNSKIQRFSSEALPEGTSMIMAFYQNESGNRIPADVVELKKEQAEAILFLYPATYDLIYLNKEGQLLMSRPLVIK